MQLQYLMLIITGIITLTLFSCNDWTNSSQTKIDRSTAKDTTSKHGYNEIENPDKRNSFSISEYNTDSSDIKNIDRDNMDSRGVRATSIAANEIGGTTRDCGFHIDLDNFYDYSPNHKDWQYISKKRYDILKKPNMDSQIVVTRQQFDTIIEKCNSLLISRRNFEIQDADHIKIIRLINTINMSQDTSFKNGIYADFMKLVKDKDYEKDISTYYDWIPNRGMGFYFQKLQVELGGTPHSYSIYTIK